MIRNTPHKHTLVRSAACSADPKNLYPTYSSFNAHNLRAAVDAPLVLQPFDRVAVPTGLIVAIPQGWEGQVRPRSGNALRLGLSMPNTPGTIDSDYRGELKVLLIHLGREPVTIERGMRIAQLVICPVGHAELTVVEKISADTERGTGGFGSTGV